MFDLFPKQLALNGVLAVLVSGLVVLAGFRASCHACALPFKMNLTFATLVRNDYVC
jgi:hypothetical protein